MIVACPDCGTVQRLPPAPRGHRLVCHRCAHRLERVRGNPVEVPLALALATLAVLFPANLMTLLHISIDGIDRSSRLGSGIIGMAQQGWVLLAIGLGLQGVILPFLRFGLLAAALSAVRLRRAGDWTGAMFRWSERLDLWAMPDVFLFGAAVGYSRVAPRLPVAIGPGGWALIAAAVLSMLTRVSLDRPAIWRHILAPPHVPVGSGLACTACDLVVPARLEGEHCPRCRARLWRRQPGSLVYASALVAAGYLLYPVANYFPMSVQLQLDETKNHTIAAGIEQLIGAGLWPLAAVIFCTSIAIPLLKLCGMTWLIWSVHRGNARRLVLKTRLYRVIEEIGRWSNIDVFTIAIFLPLMQFGGLLSVRAGLGAPAFLAVIVLTMLAVRVFDPRLLWDNAR
jgi:paraquat-inducible protein A